MPLKNLPHAAEGSAQASKTIEDGVLASSLITAPAWAPWLSELNNILTTLSLLIGLAIGVHRLWRIYQGNSTPPAAKVKTSTGPATAPDNTNNETS